MSEAEYESTLFRSRFKFWFCCKNGIGADLYDGLYAIIKK